MTFLALQYPHCDSEHVVKRDKTESGAQRSLGQNTACVRGTTSSLACLSTAWPLDRRGEMAISTFRTRPVFLSCLSGIGLLRVS